MNCPRCETVVLHERDRDGLTIDVCPTCRGVWLDRGELEKLVSRATSELQALDRRSHDDRPRRHRDDDDDDDDRRHGKRKRGWLDSLGDLFD